MMAVSWVARCSFWASSLNPLLTAAYSTGSSRFFLDEKKDENNWIISIERGDSPGACCVPDVPMFLLNTGDCLVTGESDGPEWRRGGWTAGATQLGEHPHGVVVEERPRHVDHEGRGEALVTVGILSSFDMFLPGNKSIMELGNQPMKRLGTVRTLVA